MNSNWIGIDLGTRNSSAALKRSLGTTKVLMNLGDKLNTQVPFLNHHERIKEFPSFISFKKDGSIRDVGMSSMEDSYRESEYVVWGIKRLLGKTYAELKENGELDRFPFRIRPNRKNGQCLVCVGNRQYTPEQLCAEIFKKIKQEAESQEKRIIDSVVVSVPAFYDPLRVTPIVEAARLSGFMEIRTIPEPVAAAMAYDIDITVKPIKLLVFDIGAGTLDITAGFLYKNPEKTDDFQFQVMKNTGDPMLGGMDVDDRIAEIIKEKSTNPTLHNNKSILRRVAELAKIRLSEADNIHHIVLDNFKYEFTFNQYDLKLAMEGDGVTEKNILEECRSQVMEAIQGAGWTTQDVEILLMIGGPTKLTPFHDVFSIIFNTNPRILQQIEEFYSGNEKIDRMAAVSLGAALSVDRKINDKVPHGHGIEIIKIDDEYHVHQPQIFIPRDASYPFKSKEYVIPWTNLSGLFEFKIIQHLPKSEIKHYGFEYKFIGIQKFAVRNPEFSMIIFKMGYNSNKELEVIISNAFTSETVKYVGMSRSTSVGMDYPLKVQKAPINDSKPLKRVLPTQETLQNFIDWVKVTIGLVQRKIDISPMVHMDNQQLSDEIMYLLKKGDIKADWERIFTSVNSLIWNSNSRGILTQNEYSELNSRLNDFQCELFKIELQ